MERTIRAGLWKIVCRGKRIREQDPEGKDGVFYTLCVLEAHRLQVVSSEWKCRWWSGGVVVDPPFGVLAKEARFSFANGRGQVNENRKT